MLKIIVALKKEVGNLSGYDVYYSGCGKVNATISTMEAISAGAKTIINYGTAGAVGNLSGLIEPTGFVDRDMDCLLYTSPSPRDGILSRMPSSA